MVRDRRSLVELLLPWRIFKSLLCRTLRLFSIVAFVLTLRVFSRLFLLRNRDFRKCIDRLIIFQLLTLFRGLGMVLLFLLRSVHSSSSRASKGLLLLEPLLKFLFGDTFVDASFHVRLFLHFGHQVDLGFSLGFLMQLGDHFVIVPLVGPARRLLNEEVVDDRDELDVPLVQDLGRYHGDVRFVEQKPVRVLALEDGEVGVEEGAITLKILLPGHFLLNVISCVH